jgi:S1-C subfamily serine protease
MNEEFSFMNEKIKEKPFYKKKWVTLLASTVALAVVFGAVAGGVFVKVSSKLKEKQTQAQMEEIQIPKEHPEVTETPSPTVTEEAAEEIPVPVVAELTLENYEKLMKEVQLLSKETQKAMVTITARNNDVDWFNQAYENSGQSCGMIIGDNSVELLILTKYKAVRESDGIEVTFADRKSVGAAIKKYDVTTGFAIISVNLSDLSESTRSAIKNAELGSSFGLSAGDAVVALGNGENGEFFLELGCLNEIQKNQSIVDGEYTLLSTNMIKKEGIEGVLINLKGQIVGVLSEEKTGQSKVYGITAYGISDLKNLIEHLSNNQDVTYLGIRGVSVTTEAKIEGIPSGVYVTNVEMDSPAMLGGIQSGDILQKINGQNVSTMKDVSGILQKLSDKQNITLEGKRLTKDGYKEIHYETTLSVLE